ncbi:SDR family NAD(P)-dependent oxidoreductase [Rubrolithibacter danxiaensis]|uniref:SDR family NAD(P)-dependent oxidoreductase n=1 Tax=Rubrolithibacter danxiaensis TaxID=3390805 RepID=UPI003BF8E21F
MSRCVKRRRSFKTITQSGFYTFRTDRIDVCKPESVEKAASILKERIKSLNILINNAGILGSIPQNATSVAIDNIKGVFETNFFGTIRTTQALIDLLKNAEEARIVNVTSDLASLTLHNNPSWKYYAFKGAAYGPSKTALNAYTVALAYELKDTGIKVNSVNPGYTATDFNRYSGTKNVTEAASLIVEQAILATNGPTGKFISDDGETPW